MNHVEIGFMMSSVDWWLTLFGKALKYDDWFSG